LIHLLASIAHPGCPLAGSSAAAAASSRKNGNALRCGDLLDDVDLLGAGTPSCSTTGVSSRRSLQRRHGRRLVAGRRTQLRRDAWIRVDDGLEHARTDSKINVSVA